MRETFDRLRQAAIERAVHGSGTASREARQAAFDNRAAAVPASALVDKVARRAWTVTDGDVAAARAAGLSDDEIFELTICAALGQATRQLETARAALDAAVADAATGPHAGEQS